MGTTSRRVRNICCIGAGYVGGPTCAVIANRNPLVDVCVVDLSQSRIQAWKSQALPIYEPDLYDIVATARDGTDGRTPNLHFSTDIATAIDEADLIFIAVNTPTKTAGQGAGSASDLVFVESAARMIAETARNDKIIVEKSTVPCGTAANIRAIFSALAPGIQFDILSNPEFLSEGTAIRDLLQPDRILIGSLHDDRSKAAAEALVEIYSWIPRHRIITINLWSSELAKLAANCMLAQRISSINSLSVMCEATGADIEELSYAIGLDARIGRRMLTASAGFGGSCFKKDVLSLVYIAESLHLDEVARYWRTVVDLNEYQKTHFAKRITRALHNTLARKRIAILGWAYKKNTGDSRETPAITIASQLIVEGASLAIYDPQVSEQQIMADLKTHHSNTNDVRVYQDALSACVNACAVVILTEWDEFRTDTICERGQYQVQELPADHATSPAFEEELMTTCASSDSGVNLQETVTGQTTHTKSNNGLIAKSVPARMDWSQIASVVRRPRLVFDGRGIVQPGKLVQLGFRVECIGKAHASDMHMS